MKQSMILLKCLPCPSTDMNINDEVRARTQLTRCRLIGTITDIRGETYFIRLLIPIHGVKEVQCKRQDLQLIEKTKPVQTKNKSMKTASSRIIQHLETIADLNQERTDPRISKPKSAEKINQSNNWLDYMKENGID